MPRVTFISSSDILHGRVLPIVISVPNSNGKVNSVIRPRCRTREILRENDAARSRKDSSSLAGNAAS